MYSFLSFNISWGLILLKLLINTLGRKPYLLIQKAFNTEGFYINFNQVKLLLSVVGGTHNDDVSYGLELINFSSNANNGGESSVFTETELKIAIIQLTG